MKLLRSILLILALSATSAAARENSISEFFDDTAKDTQALLNVKPDDGRKTLGETFGDLWRDLWNP